MKEFVISEVKAETAILVGLITKEQDETKTNEYLDELEFLADTAGAVTVKRFTQRMAGPSQVTYVGKAAFAYFNGTFHGAMIRQYTLDSAQRENYKGMTNIESLTLGKSLQTIGDFAFSGSKIKTLKLPASLRKIGTDAFSLSWYLTDVTFTDLEHAQLQELGGFQQCFVLKHVDVPTTVTNIGEAAFSECGKLKSISLPPSLKSVGFQRLFCVPQVGLRSKNSRTVHQKMVV